MISIKGKMKKQEEWNQTFKISSVEYESLREELIQRIILMNSQATNAITVVLTMWAAALGLFGIQVANLEKFDKVHNFWLCVGEISSLLCALLILFPLAIKSGENLRQQMAISIYIRLFYYDFIKRRQILSDSIYPWEYVSGLTNDIYMKMNSKNRILLVMSNAEYPILGLVSVIFSVSVFIANYNFIFDYSNLKNALFFVSSGIIILLELIMVVLLYRNTSINRNVTLLSAKKMEQYIRLANNMGINIKKK